MSWPLLTVPLPVALNLVGVLGRVGIGTGGLAIVAIRDG